MVRDLIFLAITLVLFAVWGIPNLVGFLRCLVPGKVDRDFETDAIDPEDYSKETQEIIGALSALGFVPLGVKVERPKTGPAAQELSYAAAEDRSFASIHGMHRQQPNMYFFTPFQDGAVVLTGDIAMQPVRSPNFLHQGVAGSDRAEQWRRHLREVEKMTKAGHLPFGSFTRDDRLKATDIYYANPAAQGLQRDLRFKTLKNFGMSLGLVVLAGLVLAYRFLR